MVDGFAEHAAEEQENNGTLSVCNDLGVVRSSRGTYRPDYQLRRFPSVRIWLAFYIGSTGLVHRAKHGSLHLCSAVSPFSSIANLCKCLQLKGLL